MVLLAEASLSFREYVANHPNAMLHMVENDQAVKEHHHAIVKPEIVAARGGNFFDQPHHVVRKIANRAADERRKTGNAHWMVASRKPPHLFDRIVVKMDFAPAGGGGKDGNRAGVGGEP